VNALLAEKLGMTQVFDGDDAVPVTVLRAGPCRVAQVKTTEVDGYSAVQLAFGDVKAAQVNKPLSGHFANAGVDPTRHLVEIRIGPDDEFAAGQQVTVGEVFAKGMRADVSAVSKGKGFTGTMRRHNFKGQLASHGVHRVHRAPGAIGACATPSRVVKGMPMAGRMGGERRTVLSLEVVDVDTERDLVLLRGAVPGPKGSLVLIRHGAKWDGDPARLLEEAAARKAESATAEEVPEDDASLEEAEEGSTKEAPAAEADDASEAVGEADPADEDAEAKTEAPDADGEEAGDGE
jgi:large subunit ribosomal protein L3